MTDQVGGYDRGGSEAELEERQDAKLYPVGRALRATYDADNHASLSDDVTGLMLDLARVPFEPHEFEPILPPLAPPPRPGWFVRMRLALRAVRQG
ncbi:MAG: hypothetical protein PGN08_04360 [Sphingomonas taxi]